MRTVIVPPGIGDSLWVLMKLINSKEQFKFILPNTSPQRGKQVFDLLPQIAWSCEYQDFVTYKKVEQASIHRTAQLFRNIKREEFCLSANGWLEEGNRIEGFLPDLETSYRLTYYTTVADSLAAEDILYKGLDDKDRFPLFGIYASAYSNARHWDGWKAEDWARYCKIISKAFPHMVFVIIGAEYDTDHSAQIMELLDESQVPYISTIGQKLSVVIEILNRLVYFTGFPSGLSILNETMGNDGTMFYPRVKKQVANIMGTWADPKRLASNAFKECLFPDPQEMAEWVLQEYGLMRRTSDGMDERQAAEMGGESKLVMEAWANLNNTFTTAPMNLDPAADKPSLPEIKEPQKPAAQQTPSNSQPKRKRR